MAKGLTKVFVVEHRTSSGNELFVEADFASVHTSKKRALAWIRAQKHYRSKYIDQWWWTICEEPIDLAPKPMPMPTIGLLRLEFYDKFGKRRRTQKAAMEA